MVFLSVESAPPEASSTLLRMHRLYTEHPPHDSLLYNILEVSPNATSDKIARSYRILSRRFHPDKVENGEERLQQVREAYEILKDDSTRLPYHQYGLTEISDAAFLLTGTVSNKEFSKDEIRLLNLMGYVPGKQFSSYQDRLFYLAANLVERIRPLVEDVISPSAMIDRVAEECAVLKKLPLGSKILRCIGRAYRHAGQSTLRQEKFQKIGELSNYLRQNMHQTKHIFEAAALQGKLLLQEKLQGNPAENDNTPKIDYHFAENEDFGDLVVMENDNDPINYDEHRKAKKVLFESLQVEALWKIRKIYLDRVINDACNTLLSGKFFFFPSHYHQSTNDRKEFINNNRGTDGWISVKGRAINSQIGRLRAASALVMIGDEMVRSSKLS